MYSMQTLSYTISDNLISVDIVLDVLLWGET